MTKELQDHVWKHCLPKEFKEEVKKVSRIYIGRTSALFGAERHLANKFLDEFIGLFGYHNLTSDAEGEDEMLCVSRKKIQEVYRQNKEEINRENVSSSDKDCYQTVNEVLKTLFGSKCLPDEEPKPAEPKFKVGDMVKYRLDGKRYEVMGKTGKYHYSLNGYDKDVLESDLEPYTEPKNKDSEFIRAESVKEARIADEETHLRNLSQETINCDKHFDNILKDIFSKERRLNIAVQIMAAMISNPSVFHHGLDAEDEDFIIYGSLEFADTLIAECEKGGDNENN